MKKTSHYDTLGVEKNFTDDELKQRYHKLARQLHPDLNDKAVNNLDDEMAQLNEAYRILRNPELRSEYDKSLLEESPRWQYTQDFEVKEPAQPRMMRFTLLALLLIVGCVIYFNFKKPNQRNFNHELGAANTLLKPQIDNALKGEVPSLEKSLSNPQGQLFKRALSPELTPENCLNAFPHELAPR